MHPIDLLLFEDLPVPPSVLARELAKPLPARGDSYWADAMRDLFEVVAPSNLGTQAIAVARTIIVDQRERTRIQAAPSP